VALHGRDAGTPPAQALLLYPVLHPWLRPSPELAACIAVMPRVLTFVNESDAINTNYLGGPISSATPYAFAGLSDDLRGYPATYIENCEFDDLRASGEEFAAQLRAAGADVELVTAAGVPHGHLNAVGSPLTHASTASPVA
jgi:xylan 1,4-beta-xylosidase